ncbi:Ubiquitin family protein [Pyrenophora tritici-repentis]|nr:Ubiquitin family protein [Pyrenophora tritici-repentis]
MAEGEQTINLKILSPSTEVEGGVNLADVPASTTVKELRSRIQNAVPSKPATDRMRLIYRGRVVANDAETLGNVFGTDNIRENNDQSLHLVLRELPANENPPFRPPQSPAALPTNPFRTTPQPRPNPQQAPGQANEQTEHGTPAQPGGPVPSSESQTPPPSGLPNLPGNSERPLQRNPFDPTGARWTVTYNQVNIPAGLPPAPFPIPPALGFGRLPIATGTPPPGLDNNQRLLPRLQRIFQETLREMENVRTLLHTPAEQGAQAGTTGLTSPASPSIPVWRIDQLRRQLNTVNQNLNVIERGLALFPTDPDAAALRRSATMLRVDALELRENDRMVNVAGHLWLIFKLAAFVYFFSGGGGLYRPIMLGIVAGIVYLAQVGVFQDQFNLLRHHFEALLAVGAMAERVAQPNNHAQQRGNLTPEEAAQRILQQRRDQRFGWVRDSMRTVERAFALFIASLFPGVGERMVHAQEERERQERVAAQEERERQEEEARRRQEEAQAEQQRDSEKKDEAHVQMGGDASVSGTSKGKERAETEIEASGSAA